MTSSSTMVFANGSNSKNLYDVLPSRANSASVRPRNVSYEDLLIEKYLDEMQLEGARRGSASRDNSKSKVIQSPYLQKLTHSNLLQSAPISNRPASSAYLNSNRTNHTSSRAGSRAGSRPGSGTRSGFNGRMGTSSSLALNHDNGDKDNNFQSASSYLQPSLHLALKKEQNRSSPSPSLQQDLSKPRKRYLDQPNLIKAVAYPNGSRNNSVFVTAKSLADFLQAATERLQLPRAARRVFLENGDEIKEESQFLKNAIVYVSCGDDFIDPYSKTKQMIDKRKAVLWKSDGLHFMYDNKEDSFNTKQSKYEGRLAKKTRFTKRLVAFENGSEFNPTLVFMELLPSAAREQMNLEERDRLEKGFLSEFLEECTNRMKMASVARVIYTWTGEQVESVHDLPKLDRAIQPFVNDVEFAPVWISKGESFYARSALTYVESLIKTARAEHREMNAERAKIGRNISTVQNENFKSTQIRLLEMQESLQSISGEMVELNESIEKLQSIRDNLQQLTDQQTNDGYTSLFKHIRNVNTNEKIFGGMSSKGINLKVMPNGQDTSFDVFYNTKTWHSEDKEIQRNNFTSLLEEINRVYAKQNSAFVVKFTRMFTENGEEVNYVNKLRNNDVVWVSQGEGWIGSKEIPLVVSVNLTSLVVMTAPGGGGGHSTTVSPRKASVEEDEEEIKEEAPKYDDDSDETFDDDDEDDEENESTAKKLVNFFKSSKKKKPKASKQNGKQVKTGSSSSKPQYQPSFDFNSNLKTFLEPLNLTVLKKYQKPEQWRTLTESSAYETLNHIATDYNMASLNEPIELDLARISQNSQRLILLECATNSNIVLYPRLFNTHKADRSRMVNNSKPDSIWFHDFQYWKINKNGFIYNQFFPKLCLTLNTSVKVKLEIRLKQANKSNKERGRQQLDSSYQDKTEAVIRTGYVVVLGTRQLNEANNYSDKDQQWYFTRMGNICSKALSNQDMFLTSKEHLVRELNHLSQNGQLDGFDLHTSTDNDHQSFKQQTASSGHDQFSLLVLDSFDSVSNDTNNNNKHVANLVSSQRWAIKQENARSIGEWRYSELSTSLWHKMALTWPVNDKEELIDKLTWPLCGLLVVGAPPLRTVLEMNGSITTPERTKLRVLRNGALDPNQAVIVSQIDAKHLMKEYIHCTKISYRQFEFNTFLATCTTALGFSSAARRLFDSEGTEHFDLTGLKQDQLVYVSVGEVWVHPKLLKNEQEKKAVLTSLADDLIRIAYFNKLKDCRNMVAETSGSSLREGTRIVLNTCCLTIGQIERIRQGESVQHVIEVEEEFHNDIVEDKPLTAHEKSHIKVAAVQAKKFRWPWEIFDSRKSQEDHRKSSHGDNDNDWSDSEAKNGDNLRDSLNTTRSFDPELADKLKPRVKKGAKNVKFSGQKFAYNKQQGYIYCLDAPNLVFGVADGENGLNEVYLMRKSEDNINQRWLLKENGVFLLKGRANMALTVKLPAIESVETDLNADEEDDDDQDVQVGSSKRRKKNSIYSNCSLVIQQLVDFENGNAHQRFFVDDVIGFIYAFAVSDSTNIEIMAANKANICSHYVSYDKELSQPGYICEFDHQERTDKAYVCTSCAKATRGRFRMTKLVKNQLFSCYIGKSKEKYFKQFDSFKYLTDKVDLSSIEAQNSFVKWLNKYRSWRRETNARVILNELSAAKSVSVIKVYAFKNGDGRLKQGELLVGSTVQGILDQATARLQLRSAARRLYTEDGTLILDVQDLITWTMDYYRKELYKPTSSASTSTSKPPAVKSVTNKKDSSLLDKVDLGDNENTIASEKSNEDKAKSNGVVTKQFVGPSRKEIKRLLDEYDRTYKVDVKRLFRWPVEAWVSCGEQFIEPLQVHKVEAQRISNREQLDRAEHELEKQKHTLRHMTGRRLGSLTPGELKPIKNPEIPVVREGHWTEVSYEEHRKQGEVNQLKNYVEHIKSPRKSNSASSASKGKSYGSYHVTKRVLIYNNGDVSDKAIYCWAATIEELHEAAKIKLRLSKPVKFLYTSEGEIISRFEEITRDQLICVSTGREFIKPEERNKEIELKANWGRTKKEEGIKAMNTVVTPKKNPIVSVDPFGPPIIANAASPKKSPQQPKKRLALPPPDKEKKEVKQDKEVDKPPKETREKEKEKEKIKEKSPQRSILKRDEDNEETGGETGGESGKENDRLSRRPKSGRVRSPKRSKAKSKSPKQVSISTELPTKKDLVESDIGNGNATSNGISHANGFSFSTLLDQKTDDDEEIEENYGAGDFDDEDINDLI